MVIEGIIDTSIIIDYLRQYAPAQIWLQNQAQRRFAITPIVWMETVQGATNKTELERALQVLQQFSIEHSTVHDNNWAMRQLAQFYLSHGIQFQDVMIASVAVRLNVPLFTINVKHYNPLPSVSVQRPY